MNAEKAIRIGLVLAAGLLSGCRPEETEKLGATPTTQSARVHGVSVAHSGGRGRGGGYGSPGCKEQFEMLKGMGVNWVALNNFAWMGSVTSPELRFSADRSLGEGDMGQAMDDARAVGLGVCVKPHIWSRDFGRAGKWHGDIAMTSEADWDAFFADYTDYIVTCAKVAEEAKAGMFCVGVEYVGTSKQTERWRKVIQAVRAVYHGRVTYSAAFTEWKQIEFWGDLDLIAIAAYFPLVDHDSATEAELRAGWGKVYEEMEALARKTGKMIVFSELGYSPATKAGKEPWAYDIPVRDEAYQALLYRVALEEVEKRPFIEGVFLWKWFSSPNAAGWDRGDPFTIQNKPKVVEVIKGVWGK